MKNDAEEFIHEGNAHFLREDYQQAIECYRQALIHQPDFAQAHNNMGVACGKLGNHLQAIECYQQALIYQPDFAKARSNLGVSYAELSNYTQAIKCFRQALTYQPDDANFYYNMGVAYADLGNYTQAIECYRLTLIHQSDYAKARFYRGVAYQKIQDMGKAQADFVRYVFLTKAANQNPYELLAFFRDEANAPFVANKILKTIPLRHLQGYEHFINRIAAQCRPIQDFLDYLQMRGFDQSHPEDYLHFSALCQYFMGDMAEAERIFDYEIESEGIPMRMMSHYYYLQAAVLSALPESSVNTLRQDVIREAEAVFNDVHQKNLVAMYYAGLIFYRHAQDVEKAHECFRRAKGLLPARYMLWLTELPQRRWLVVKDIEEREAHLPPEQTYRQGLHPRQIGRDVASYWSALQHYCFY